MWRHCNAMLKTRAFTGYYKHTWKTVCRRKLSTSNFASFNLNFLDMIQTLRVSHHLKANIVPVYVADLISKSNCDAYKTNQNTAIPTMIT